jgi:hypothetical protein
MAEALRQADVSETHEPAVSGLMRWKMVGEHPPRAAAAHHIEQGVDHFAHRPLLRAARAGGRHEKLPFGFGQVATVTQVAAIML